MALPTSVRGPNALVSPSAFGTTIQSPFEAPAYAPLTPESILFSGGVMFGSRALGVDKHHSDYDIAICKANFKALVADRDIPFSTYPIDDYFEVVPPSGDNNLLKYRDYKTGDSIDIVVLEHQHDVDIMRAAIAELRLSPKSELTPKHWRITAFEKALLKLGHIRNTNLRRPRQATKITEF